MKTQLIALVLILTILVSACSQPSAPAAPEEPSAADAAEEETATEPEAEEPVTETKGDEKGVSAGGEAASVVINNFKFTPAELKVKKGTTVTWRNEDTAAHTVESSIADNKVLKSDELSPDDTFTFTFDETGTFPYLCGLHRSMKGKVIVE